MSAAVIVVNYNSAQLLAAHLAPSGLHEVPARIVVVDNSEGAEHKQQARELCQAQEWEYVDPGGNVGFGAGVNAGAKRAAELGDQRLIILNPDAWITVGTARALVQACADHPMRACAPIVRRPDGRVWFDEGRLAMDRGRLHTTARGAAKAPPESPTWLTGACLAISWQLFDLVGGFSEEYFMYWEDVDLSWRIREAGGDVAVLGDLSATHAVSATQAGEHKSPLFVYYNCRNRLLFAGANLDPDQRRGWLRETPKLTWELIGLGGRTPQALRAAATGTASGLRTWRSRRVAAAAR